MSGELERWTLLWWTWIAPLSVQAVVLIPLVALIDRFLPSRTWPQLRAAMWTLVLLRLVIPPGWPGPTGLAELLPVAGSWPATIPLPDLAAAIDAGSRADVMPWAQAIFVLWAIGFLGATLWPAMATQRLRRRWGQDASRDLPSWLQDLARENAALLGLRRLPPIVFGPSIPTPCVVGALRPTVYLPASFLSTVKQSHLRHVLLHELAHVRRGDTRAAFAGSLIQAMYWFHPFVWWAHRRAHQLREPCCDRTVARALGEGTAAYRRTLMLFASGQLLPAPSPSLSPPGPGGLGFLRPESLAMTRLRLLEHHLERTWLRRAVTSAVLVLLFAFGLPFAGTADRAVAAVGEVIERPPGCLPLRYLVLQRLAEEEAKAAEVEAERQAGVKNEAAGQPRSD